MRLTDDMITAAEARISKRERVPVRDYEVAALLLEVDSHDCDCEDRVLIARGPAPPIIKVEECDRMTGALLDLKAIPVTRETVAQLRRHGWIEEYLYPEQFVLSSAGKDAIRRIDARHA